MGWATTYYCERLGVTFKRGDKFIVKGKGYTNAYKSSGVGYDYTNDPTEKAFYGFYTDATYPETVAHPICFQDQYGNPQYYISDDAIYANVSGTVKTYTVSYNANGGTGAPSSQTKTHAVRLQLSSVAPKRTGYTFMGWGVSASDASVDYMAGSYYEINGSITLYAIWQINAYKLAVNANGGTWNGSTDSKEFVQNYGTTKEIENPSRVGYTFNGWTLSGSGSFDGTKFTYGAGNAALTAKWVRISLTVTFNASTNGGSPDSTKSVYYGDTIGTLPSPKKPYYKFVGWFTASGVHISASEVVTENVTYYARFKIDATVKVGQNGEKKPAIVWIGRNGAWKKHIVWIGKNGVWNKSTGAD